MKLPAPLPTQGQINRASAIPILQQDAPILLCMSTCFVPASKERHYLLLFVYPPAGRPPNRRRKVYIKERNHSLHQTSHFEKTGCGQLSIPADVRQFGSIKNHNANAQHLSRPVPAVKWFQNAPGNPSTPETNAGNALCPMV